MSFPCPVCGADTEVIDTRLVANGQRRRRRIKCDAGHRFSSDEVIDLKSITEKKLKITRPNLLRLAALSDPFGRATLAT